MMGQRNLVGVNQIKLKINLLKQKFLKNKGFFFMWKKWLIIIFLICWKFWLFAGI